MTVTGAAQPVRPTLLSAGQKAQPCLIFANLTRPTGSRPQRFFSPLRAGGGLTSSGQLYADGRSAAARRAICGRAKPLRLPVLVR